MGPLSHRLHLDEGKVATTCLPSPFLSPCLYSSLLECIYTVNFKYFLLCAIVLEKPVIYSL